jgi:hypothetical protein
MAESKVSVVLVHGAWADGSSWSKVVSKLRANGVEAVTAPVPLTTLADDVAAVERTLSGLTDLSRWSATLTPALSLAT